MAKKSQLLYNLDDYERIIGFPFSPESHPITENDSPIRKTITTKMRAIIWDRTDGHCFHCTADLHPFRDFHVDHLIPLSKGGPDDIGNMVPACSHCNMAKGGSLC